MRLATRKNLKVKSMHSYFPTITVTGLATVSGVPERDGFTTVDGYFFRSDSFTAFASASVAGAVKYTVVPV
jgi:hypothetical protein